MVGGNDWSSAERWIEQSDTLKFLKDPANNLAFEAHLLRLAHEGMLNTKEKIELSLQI